MKTFNIVTTYNGKKYFHNFAKEIKNSRISEEEEFIKVYINISYIGYQSAEYLYDLTMMNMKV